VNNKIKHATTRLHTCGTQWSASISSIEDKVNGMKVEVYETKTTKVYYFVFPYFSYEHCSDSIEIPFDKCGVPMRQKSKWWQFEVKNRKAMKDAVIYNDKDTYYANSSKTTINDHFSFDNPVVNTPVAVLTPCEITTSVIHPLTPESIVWIKVHNSKGLTTDEMNAELDLIKENHSSFFAPAQVLITSDTIDIEIYKK